MSDAEVMTTTIVAAMYFSGKQETARQILKEQGDMLKMMSKSQFSRRLHRLDTLFVMLFRVIGGTFKALNREPVYIIDSVPVLVCDNIRIKRSKLYTEEAYVAIKPANDVTSTVLRFICWSSKTISPSNSSCRQFRSAMSPHLNSWTLTCPKALRSLPTKPTPSTWCKTCSPRPSSN